jgi:nucleoside-diphosphate-sugar epimerase
MSSSPLVLITGATGHLGFRTLIDLLTAGYYVRAAVRSEAKKQVILANPAYKALKLPADRLTFALVPDLTVAGAYDEAIKGTGLVVHIASPIAGSSPMSPSEHKRDLIDPAVRGTLGMLEAASREPGVRRVVITSSVVAIKPFSEFVAGDAGKAPTRAEDRIPSPAGPYGSNMEAYSASKAASLNEAEKWLEGTKPAFDVVFVHPSFIEGRDELAATREQAGTGTNRYLLLPATGVSNPTPLATALVHNDDVARIHVQALDEKIPAGSYIASYNPQGRTDGAKWEDINKYVSEYFPDAVKKGVLPNSGKQQSVQNNLDTSKTEATFGWKFQGLDSMVKSVVGHYVELQA